MALADQIQRRRLEKKLSLTELANLAQVSKGYLSQLENNPDGPRPSADILYRIAFALETTVGELLEKRSPNMSDQPAPIPPGLREFAAHSHLGQDEIQMLAQIKYKGDQPKTADDWRFLYESIKRVIRSGKSEDSSQEEL